MQSPPVIYRLLRITPEAFYFFSLALLIIGLPFSPIITSISQFLLLGNWLVECNFKQKLNILRSDKSVLVFISIFALHLVGLLYTSDFEYAIHDLRIKLPLLLLPLIIGTTNPLSEKQLRYLVLLLVMTLAAKAIVGFIIYLGLTNITITDSREISGKLSHIRFSLLIVLGIFSSLYYLIFKRKELLTIEKTIFTISVLWLTMFLFILQSLTGIVIFFVLLFSYLIVYFLKPRSRTCKSVFFILLFLSFFSITFVIYSSFHKSLTALNVDVSRLDKFTSRGNPYIFTLEKKVTENGNRVYFYICYEEVKQGWNKLSSFNFEGYDRRGNKIEHVLYRYMTSKNLRKDADGLRQLSRTDIANIENGQTNYRFSDETSLSWKFYKLKWEIENYLSGSNPSGFSVSQRFEFQKTGFNIFRQNVLLGVGTGDVQQSFDWQYVIDRSPLLPKFRLRAHCQWLTILIAFGILGFAWFCFAIVYPVFRHRKWNDFLFVTFFAVAVLSFFNEDTLETQVGVTFFAFFYSLFLFRKEIHIFETKLINKNRYGTK